MKKAGSLHTQPPGQKQHAGRSHLPVLRTVPVATTAFSSRPIGHPLFLLPFATIFPDGRGRVQMPPQSTRQNATVEIRAVAQMCRSQLRSKLAAAPPPRLLLWQAIESTRNRPRRTFEVWTPAAEDLPPGADLALARAAPPRVTLLTVPLRVSPGPDEYPMVLAVDPSGLLLLLSTPPAPSPPPSPPSSPDADGFVTLNITDRTPPRLLRLRRLLLRRRPPPRPRARLPRRPLRRPPRVPGGKRPLHGRRAPAAHWQRRGHAALLLVYGIWNTDAAITNAGKLCWVDLSSGILSCDPFAEEPVLDFVELPEGRLRRNIDCLHCAGRELSTRRCVQVRAGMFRLVELTCGDHGSRPRGVVLASWMRLQQAQSRSHRKAPRVVMWTLADPDTGEWKVEHRVNFADVWADESYKATGLPKKTPVLALVHPKNPDVVYFFLGKHLFGVNLRTRKVVECEVYKLVGPSRKHVSSGCVHSWELPASLCAGIPSETDSSVNEGSASVAANDMDRD